MSERFFSDQPITGDTALLAQQEAHHLLHVMRLKAGDCVTLFDGSGAEFVAEVTRCGRSDVELAVLSREPIDRELPAPLVVVSPLPKGDRQRWMIEKLTELGVSRLLLVDTERSVAKVWGGMPKLERAVIEASKQCRRNRLMTIESPGPWRSVLADPELSAARYIAHPNESAEPRAPQMAASIDAGVVFAIGPEGGFTDEEIQAAIAASWTPLDFGSRILRTETAAIAAAVRGAAMLNHAQ